MLEIMNGIAMFVGYFTILIFLAVGIMGFVLKVQQRNRKRGSGWG